MSPKEIAALKWGLDEKAALVHIETKEMPYVVMTKNESDINWLREIKASLNMVQNPAHPLADKLELVYRPE